MLNDKAYHYHYISLDSTELYAKKALAASKGYKDGRVEALNNLAFVDIIRMKFPEAENRLAEVIASTDNQFELLVANIQMMRICQRQTRNKRFYEYYWQATQQLERINEELDHITSRQRMRYVYAKSEFDIVLSAYLYYVGQLRSSIEALASINENDEIQRDTSQLLNYYYNVGSGDFLSGESAESIAQKELDYLVQCYFLANKHGYVFWQANALQAISEHLQNEEFRPRLIESHLPAMKYLNVEEIPDSLLAGTLAERAVGLFADYGDIYQTAGALRTLSNCYFGIEDYHSAISCLNEALERDTIVNQTPALTSSIFEKLSIVYSAIDDKSSSDYYRNQYLDLQENTRQDRELEARRDQLDAIALQQNLMIAIVCAAIIVVLVLLYVFTRLRMRKEKDFTADSLLKPLETWKLHETHITENIAERHEEILEEQQTAELLLERNLRRNVEQRAKMALVNSITPFIDRMLAEIKCLKSREESEEVVRNRYTYILELTDKINEYNAILTDWIQLRKGELNLKIESFALQDLFDIMRKARMSFEMKGIDLQVEDTDVVVKADKTLTLFMLNTMADNARKATEQGGRIRICAQNTTDYVEISISDTGKGMSEEEVANVFNHQPAIVQAADEGVSEGVKAARSSSTQHGFGLMNCKGIIEKYKKISQLFAVCSISAKSQKGKGSVFSFRLPHGVMRILMAVALLSGTVVANAQDISEKIKMYADSAYFCNLQGRYANTLSFADSARTYLNIYYKQLRPKGKDLMVLSGGAADKAAELKWLADSVKMDFGTILDMRNETAVAALALHEWDIYNYNNKVYSRLFREASADPSLVAYVSQMKHASETKYVAIMLLLIIFLCIVPAYYVLYYRFKVYYRFLIDRLGAINRVLLEDIDEKDKLQRINVLWFEGNRFDVSNKETALLNDVVAQICKALQDNISVRRKSNEEIELAEDELRRLNFEIERLHVNNNVLDNCFSTLKHETMYYPSRIRQLVDETERNLVALSEITVYYKELYTLLSMQAQHQVDSNMRIDFMLVNYLLSLLSKLSGEKKLPIQKENIDNTYSLYRIPMKNLQLNDDEVVHLFTPLTNDLSCLLIRQIIREIGETTNHRGCGVQAQKTESGVVEVLMTLSNKVKLNI